MAHDGRVKNNGGSGAHVFTLEHESGVAGNGEGVPRKMEDCSCGQGARNPTQRRLRAFENARGMKLKSNGVRAGEEAGLPTTRAGKAGEIAALAFMRASAYGPGE